ncbi:hypothetical protein Tco_1125342 [Tanacetum coccineum]|uniref:Uncharacterized protein n=1 Tax=Tanacetum coccineum TaxID=301880 RepID=A0ABQ5JBJ8_9ASTR
MKNYMSYPDKAIRRINERHKRNGTISFTKIPVPVTAKEKTNKKNDVKARSLLLMALPNEHQLTFSEYTDAKTMFAAIETAIWRCVTLPEKVSSIRKEQRGYFKNQATLGKQGYKEDTSSKVLLAIDGCRFDWSDMAQKNNAVLKDNSDDSLVKEQVSKVTSSLAPIKYQSKGKDGINGNNYNKACCKGPHMLLVYRDLLTDGHQSPLNKQITLSSNTG